VGQSTLTHFYSLHTFILPLLTAVFMLMHFPMIRKHGIKFNFKKQHFLVWFQIITIYQDETYNLQRICAFLQIHKNLKMIKKKYWVIGAILIIFHNKLQKKSFIWKS
jgi:cytochrome b6